MKIKKHYQKIAALFVAMAMCLSVLSGTMIAKAANETIDTSRTGSITVTKYAGPDTAAKGDATGTTDDGKNIDSSYQTLNGATFKLFKIADADQVMNYYNGSDKNTFTVDKFSYDGTTAKYNGNTIDSSDIYEQTTDGQGTCTFSGLAVGIYVFVETTAPSHITAPLAETSLISIPMVNTDTSDNNDSKEWMYDVHVYPKNHESTGTVELTKQDQAGNALKGVTFELYKKEFDENGNLTGDWAQVVETTDNNGDKTKLATSTGADGKITFIGLPSGLYGTQYKLVEVYKEGTSPEGYIINSNPLYFQITRTNTVTWNKASGEKGDCNNANTGVVGTPAAAAGDPAKLLITLKNELPSFEKKVKSSENDTWAQDAQYKLDEEITYQLTAYVPANVAELYTFTIKDTPDAGLTDTTSGLTVAYGDAKDACNNTLSTGYRATANGNGFELTFDSAKATIAGKYVQITYKANMNADAVIAGNGNGNQASLVYSKFIHGTDTTSTYTITDEARVYTYQYQITKYKDSASAGNEIGGVEFNLLYKEDGEAVKVVQTTDGEYRLALAGETGTTTLVTKADGTILIKGLKNGDYYLKETKTIANYNLLSKPVTITVNVTETTTWNTETAFDTSGKTMKSFGSVSYNVTDAKEISTIVNKKGFTLPKTGSMGFILFCLAGLVLIAGGSFLIFGGRKKRVR